MNVTCDVGCENVSATTKNINNALTTYYLINDTSNNWHFNITGLTYGQIISFNATGNTTLGAKGYSDNRAITFYICGSLPSSLTLLYDVVANQTCFSLGASSIILDCNGHTITYSTVSGNNGYGVFGNSVGSGSTIKNCIFNRGASTWQSSAIRAYAIGSFNINNVTISVTQSTDYGIGLIGVSTANITNSNISCSGSPCQALLLSPTGISTTNIEVWNTTLSSIGGDAVYALSANNLLFSEVNITSTARALDFLGNVFNTLFRNSYINATTFLQTSFSNNYDNYFLNTTIPTFTYSLTSTSNFTRQWYARINVTNSAGSPLTSTIIVSDNLSRVALNTTSNLTNYFIVNDTSYTSTSKINYNNQTISVNSTGYDNVSIMYNFSKPDVTVNITLTLTPIIIPPILPNESGSGGGPPPAPRCSDGTLYGQCSTVHQGVYCIPGGLLIENSSCGAAIEQNISAPAPQSKLEKLIQEKTPEPVKSTVSHIIQGTPPAINGIGNFISSITPSFIKSFVKFLINLVSIVISTLWAIIPGAFKDFISFLQGFFWTTLIAISIILKTYISVWLILIGLALIVVDFMYIGKMARFSPVGYIGAAVAILSIIAEILRWLT